MKPVLVLIKGKDTVVAGRAYAADSFLERFVGWLGRARLEPGDGLWLRPCSGIHSFGMRVEFDALFLDTDHRVVKRVSEIKPWRMIGARSASVLELPAGSIERLEIELGEQLVFEDRDDRGRA